MSRSGDDGSEMPRPDPFDDATIDALLAGSPAAGTSAALSVFVEEVRAAAGAVPTPSPVLAAAIAAGGISTHQPPVAKWRKFRMKLKGFLAGLGIAGKLALGVGVAAAATTGAGAAGVLPGPVQHAVSQAVESVTPFSMPGDGHHESHDGNLATGDVTTTTVSSDVTPTTTSGSHEPEKKTSHDNKDVVVTPTTVVEHHDGNNSGATPTTVAENHDNNNTGSNDGNVGGNTGGNTNQGDGQKNGDGGGDTTTPTTVHHEENHNPEAIALSCTRSYEQVTITCTWTASPNADHDHYIVLRTHDGDPNGRAFFPASGALSYTDSMVSPGGASYTYLVDSLRADGSVSAHSNRVTVYCCGDAPVTTTTVSGDNHI